MPNDLEPVMCWYRTAQVIAFIFNSRQHQLRQSIFALNEELNLTVYDSGLARRLEEAFQQDLSYARKITYEE
jgi:hypothetical protein